MLLDAKKEYNYKSPTSNSGIFLVSSKQKWLNLLQELI